MHHGLFIDFDGSPAGLACSLVAYLDPGTGSYAVQLLLAGLFGGLFALKQSWADLKVRLDGWFATRSGPTATLRARPDAGAARPSPLAPRSHAHGPAPTPAD